MCVVVRLHTKKINGAQWKVAQVCKLALRLFGVALVHGNSVFKAKQDRGFGSQNTLGTRGGGNELKKIKNKKTRTSLNMCVNVTRRSVCYKFAPTTWTSASASSSTPAGLPIIRPVSQADVKSLPPSILPQVM